MATLLPLAEQQFCDGDGAPLAGGYVFFYIPGTTQPKDTWQDPGGTIPNQNPVILDASGRAIIYGVGAYRQVVKDDESNLIWDQVTADTASSAASWAGIAGGTANNLILAAPNFASVDGQAIDFIALSTNTGAIQATINGTVVPVKIDTLAGPVQTPAGCVVAGDRYRLTYDETAGLLHLTPLVDKGYVDAGDASSLAQAEAYATSQAQSALAQAEAYAAAQAGSALSQAEANTAAAAAQAQANAIAAAAADATNKANAAQAAATAAAEAYASNAAAQAGQGAEAYATSQAGSALTQANNNTAAQIANLSATCASTYVQGIRLGGQYASSYAGRGSGSVCIQAGSSSTSEYAYIQYNINGTWINTADAS